MLNENFYISKVRMFLYSVLILFTILSSIKAECDVCQIGNYAACHSLTTFSICLEGKATRDYIDCPAGYVCTGEFLTCYPAKDAIPSCEREVMNLCGICNEPHKTFSCIDETTVAFCFGNNEPNYEALAYCPTGTFCDINNKEEFCTEYAEGAVPSCRKDTMTTTTTDPPTISELPTTSEPSTTTTKEPSDEERADKFCKDNELAGHFKNEKDSSCKSYIKCFKFGDEIIGEIVQCPNGQYFHENIFSCKNDKPTDPTCVIDNGPILTEPPPTTTEPPTTEPPTTEPPTTEPPTTEPPTTEPPTTEPPTTEPPTTEPPTTEPPTTEPPTTEPPTTELPTTSEPPTTTEEPSDEERADKFCKDNERTGHFKNEKDSSCTSFINCFKIGVEINGDISQCPNGQYFHEEISSCKNVKPTDPNCVIPTTMEPPTTTVPLTDDERAQKFCESHGTPGSYKDEKDPMCRKYKFCFELPGDNKLYGLMKKCPSSTPYFHENSLPNCKSAKPVDCE